MTGSATATETTVVGVHLQWLEGGQEKLNRRPHVVPFSVNVECAGA